MQQTSLSPINRMFVASPFCAALALFVTTCSSDSQTGVWIRLISPEVAVTQIRLLVFDATSFSLDPVARVDVPDPPLSVARKFDLTSQEPENQLWVLILAGSEIDEKIRLSGIGYNGSREVAFGELTQVVFKKGEIRDQTDAEGNSLVLELRGCTDQDEDGYCPPLEDCDDSDPSINIGALERCDELDNNCNGSTDENCPCSAGAERPCWPQWARDLAITCLHDEYPACPCKQGTQVCNGGVWGNCEQLELPTSEGASIGSGENEEGIPCTNGCRDENGQPTVCGANDFSCYPTCRDQEDNDCDFFLNEKDVGCGGCIPGTNKPCYTCDPPESLGVGECHGSVWFCQADGSWPTECVGQQCPESETCDGRDNDCDGEKDEKEDLVDTIPCSHPVGCCADAVQICTGPDGYRDCLPEEFAEFARGTCYRPDLPTDYQYYGEEKCDNLDNDCNGSIDDGISAIQDCDQRPGIREHATVTGCSAGQCLITCESGWGDCDGDWSNGCENSLDSLTHCGGCNIPCARDNAIASCAGDQCHIESCNPGWGDCNGRDIDGCENSLDSLDNCGSCGTTCARPHATASCAGDRCHIQSCDTLWGDCDGEDDNGCETSLNTVSDCGNCGRTCTCSICKTPTCVVGDCTCPNVRAGEDPFNQCEPAACTNTGYCDGSGACQVPERNTDPNNYCPTATCKTGHCDGNGGCDNLPAGSEGDENGGAPCPICQDCNSSGSCTTVAYDNKDVGCNSTCRVCRNGSCVYVPAGEDPRGDCQPQTCKTGNCDGAGGCENLPAGSEGNESGGNACPVCQDCNDSGSCTNVSNGQQDVGCNGGQTTCSNADTCDGSGSCNLNHLPSGAEGNGSGCPVCQDCNGSGACANVTAGQPDVGCDAAATTCSNADTCNGSGTCLANDLSAGSEGNGSGCPVCQDCNGSGDCAQVTTWSQDVGCSDDDYCCSASGTCVNNASQCPP